VSYLALGGLRVKSKSFTSYQFSKLQTLKTSVYSGEVREKFKKFREMKKVGGSDSKTLD
jgi:hypothetical protein